LLPIVVAAVVVSGIYLAAPINAWLREGPAHVSANVSH
jgi:hypothetical protein